ncbi:d5-atpase-helicase [Vairimorpha apis BRL 01]|uniref:D5-atpase-helicase n=1 Tax=Vairimorpha apis BRL 01 TaxID=1037528 RepID=T0LCD1_9MICR|nr:d5-atpase-helicase [Vairimorpha apis BRL 01]
MLTSAEINSSTWLDLLEVFSEYMPANCIEACKDFIEFRCSSSLADVFLQSEDCKKFIISNENMYVKEGVTYKRVIKSKTFNDLVLFMISSKFNYAKNLIKSVPRYNRLTKVMGMFLQLTRGRNMQANVLSHIRTSVTDNSFESKLDKNTKIIPFLNGVYDLSINAFRNYLENDLCSFCIQYEYSECNDFELIESIFSDLFQNPEEREYTLSVLASLLDSSLPNDNLIIFKGHGSNGKSLLVRLLSKTLGPFSTSLSSSFFNQDPTVTNGPSPTMSDLEFKKVAFVAEPSINSLKTNIIKKIMWK